MPRPPAACRDGGRGRRAGQLAVPVVRNVSRRSPAGSIFPPNRRRTVSGTITPERAPADAAPRRPPPSTPRQTATAAAGYAPPGNTASRPVVRIIQYRLICDARQLNAAAAAAAAATFIAGLQEAPSKLS